MPSHYHRTMDAKEAEEKSSPKEGKHTLVKNINIERAKNGFTVSHRHEEKPSKGDKPMPYQEPKQMVFQDSEDAADHVKGLMDSTGNCPACK